MGLLQGLFQLPVDHVYIPRCDLGAASSDRDTWVAQPCALQNRYREISRLWSTVKYVARIVLLRNYYWIVSELTTKLNTYYGNVRRQLLP